MSIGIWQVILLLILTVPYFLPTIVAMLRGHPQTGGVFLLNIMIGWTGIGWLGVAVWSVVAEKKEAKA
jgi:hypothetical protein